MLRRSFLGAVLAAVLFAASSAIGASTSRCVHASSLDQLLRQSGLSPTFVGVSEDGALMTLYRDSDEGWFLLVTGFWGETCIILSGHSWQRVLKPGRSLSENPS